MTEQTKTNEQILREVLEDLDRPFLDKDAEKLLMAGYNFYFVQGCKAVHEQVYKDVHKALEEADKAESVSQQSNRELKRYFDGEAIGRAEVLQEVIERIKIKKEALPIHLENMLKKKPSTNSKEDDEMFMNLIIGASNITLDFVLDLLESELR